MEYLLTQNTVSQEHQQVICKHIHLSEHCFLTVRILTFKLLKKKTVTFTNRIVIVNLTVGILRYHLLKQLAYWVPVTHIYDIINSGIGLSSVRQKAIAWISADLYWFGPWGKLVAFKLKIQTFSRKKIHLKMSSAKLYLFC